MITDIGLNIEKAATEEKNREVKECVDQLSEYINNVEIIYKD